MIGIERQYINNDVCDDDGVRVPGWRLGNPFYFKYLRWNLYKDTIFYVQLGHEREKKQISRL